MTHRSKRFEVANRLSDLIEDKKQDEEQLLDLHSGDVAEDAAGDAADDSAGAGDAPAAPETVRVEDIELFEGFIQESLEHLQDIEQKILALEAEPEQSVVDEIFRSMHTVKGLASFFGMQTIEGVSHSLESVLQDLRSDRIEVSPGLVDVLLEGADLLSRLLADGDKALSAVKGPGKQGNVEIVVAGTDISALIERTSRLQADRSAAASAPPPPATSAPPARSDTAAATDFITAEILARFQTEAGELMDRAEQGILQLEDRPQELDLVDEPFRAVHTIKGNAGFLGHEAIERSCTEMESALEAIRTGKSPADTGTISVLLAQVDDVRRALRAALPDAPVEGPLDERPVAAPTESSGATPAEPADDTNATQRRDIRVDMDKLDRLFDLMGELITAQEMVTHNPDLQGLELESFSRAATYLGKITRQMQEITLTVRMIPLDGLFSKMRRLVRDLARKSEKPVRFEVHGQETEMDRNVIEEISDPLVHMIRNAIDHGLEPAEARAAAGKPATGTVTLSARHEGNEIWLTVTDDGAGLDRQKILATAEQRGLLHVDPTALADEQVWQLVFEPGFSTAERVSEISGRGVGMDVVKRNIEKLRGKIDITSSPGTGTGTQVDLKIPLTLAIIDGITLSVGGLLFAMPLGDILEFHKAEASQVTEVQEGRTMVRIRDEVIPVVKLSQVYHANTEIAEVHEGIIIVTAASGRKVGLLVDSIVGYQQIVVKALPEYLSDMRAVSGCSVLSTGDVCLIVDTGALVREELDELMAVGQSRLEER